MVQAGKVGKRPLRPPRLEVLVSEAQIRDRVGRLGRRITRDYRGRKPVFVCVLKGSFVFAADLIRRVDLPLTLDFIRLSSYGNGTEPGAVRVVSDTAQPLRGKHVILVEDIVDTGLTLRRVLGLISARKPASLAVCTLLWKPERERVRVPIDYVGFRIPNRFAVGYGLDCAEEYRNLRYVAALPR